MIVDLKSLCIQLEPNLACYPFCHAAIMPFQHTQGEKCVFSLPYVVERHDSNEAKGIAS